MALTELHAIATLEMQRKQFARPARVVVAAVVRVASHFERQLLRLLRCQPGRASATLMVPQAFITMQRVGLGPAFDAARVFAEPARDLVATMAQAHQQHCVQAVNESEFIRTMYRTGQRSAKGIFSRWPQLPHVDAARRTSLPDTAFVSSPWLVSSHREQSLHDPNTLGIQRREG